MVKDIKKRSIDKFNKYILILLKKTNRNIIEYITLISGILSPVIRIMIIERVTIISKKYFL
tara:strand:+ start:572 stop:754 length:183 start_codon:yes stop_codon:yes gene_type:complete